MTAGQEVASGLPRILVAERDQSIAELLLTFLQGEGYELSLAPSLESALERLDEQTFHLVLTDLFIDHPRRPFAHARRLLQRSLSTPVGLMTGWQVSPEAARRQGFAFFLPKPFDLDSLLTEITICLNQPLTPEQERQFQVLKRFVEGLRARNWELLGQVLTEDITYYPPLRALASGIKRVRGLAAVFTYIVEAQARYGNVDFDGFMFYPRPRGWALRYSSHWRASDGSSQNLAGALLFHFRGERIHRIGIQWDDERLRTLLRY